MFARAALVLAVLLPCAPACLAAQEKPGLSGVQKPAEAPIKVGVSLPANGAPGKTNPAQPASAPSSLPAADLEQAEGALETLRLQVRALEAKLAELEALEKNLGPAQAGGAPRAGGAQTTDAAALALALLEQLSGPDAARDPELAHLAEILVT